MLHILLLILKWIGQKKIAMAGIADSYIFLTEKMKEVFPKDHMQ